MTTVSNNQDSARGRRHSFVGVVLSAKADKTRIVSVERLTRHPEYEKIVRRRSKFYVHDEKNEARLGDLVEIMGTRRISKLKRWRLVRIVKAAPQLGKEAAEAESQLGQQDASAVPVAPKNSPEAIAARKAAAAKAAAESARALGTSEGEGG